MKKTFHQTKKYKKNMSIAKKGQGVGEKNSQWKGGITLKDNKNYMKNYLYNRLEKKAGRSKPEQCELCGIYEKDLKNGLCYDHDHKTGKFRGWICVRCNVALGMVKDNSELLLKMVEYIKNN